MQYHIKNLNLAKQGRKEIKWAEKNMPVLRLIKQRFKKEKPLKEVKIAACLHVTTETANLMIALKSGGAEVALSASNPLSTKDSVAASLVRDYKIPVFAIFGEDRKVYYENLNKLLDFVKNGGKIITLDDGADLISLIHGNRKEISSKIIASLEETTTGVIRLRALEKSNKLMIPIIAVNDAKTKNLFDNRYGTGQSTIDGIIRATNILLAGKNIVVAGYGWCGKGFASRARGMGAKVIITEVDEIRALEAAMDGFRVMPMIEAAKIGDLFCTLTGDADILNKEHFKKMKDGAIVCNSGHFNVEINIDDLEKISKKINKNIRNFTDEYILENNNRIYLLAQGRLVNLVAANGHPSDIMDMSFSTQALSVEYAIKNNKLDKKVNNVPKKIEKDVAQLKLDSMGIAIDKLSHKQRHYLQSWQIGT